MPWLFLHIGILFVTWVWSPACNSRRCSLCPRRCFVYGRILLPRAGRCCWAPTCAALGLMPLSAAERLPWWVSLFSVSWYYVVPPVAPCRGAPPLASCLSGAPHRLGYPLCRALPNVLASAGPNRFPSHPWAVVRWYHFTHTCFRVRPLPPTSPSLPASLPSSPLPPPSAGFLGVHSPPFGCPSNSRGILVGLFQGRHLINRRMF